MLHLIVEKDVNIGLKIIKRPKIRIDGRVIRARVKQLCVVELLQANKLLVAKAYHAAA